MTRIMERKSWVLAYFLAACVALQCGAVTCLAEVTEPASDGSMIIYSSQPLNEATTILGDRYGTPVTLEEPTWLWKDDALIRKTSPPFFFPGGLNPEHTPSLESAAQLLLDSYHAQNPDGTRFLGPRYRVETSSRGVHIMPVQVRNGNGDLIPATSILDVHVSVPAELRLASEHLRAVCKAIGVAAGIKLLCAGPFSTLDPYFAANGIIAPRNANSLPPEDKAQYSFVWGVSEVTGREAVWRLLDQSATTLSWRLFCEASPKIEDRFHLLDVSLMRARTKGEDGTVKIGPGPLKFDRLAKPPLPPKRQ
jgi:hypothetical protein